MTFYEPNPDVHETGAEVAEFDDAPPAPDADDETPFDRDLPGSQQPPPVAGEHPTGR